MVEDSQEHEQGPAPARPASAGSQAGGEVDPDTHRGFVREMNQGFASVYGYGGAVVVALLAGGLALAVNFGVLGSPLVWIGAVVLFLIALFVLRIVVRRRAQRMHERIGQYCAINDISVDEFKDRYAGEGLYPYFESIFEVVERRDKLRKQLRDSQ